jgi:hypothetical protein
VDSLAKQNGVDPGEIIEIRGYADTHLRYADRPEDAGNRRIAIVVLNSFSRENFSPIIDMSERDKLAGKDLLRVWPPPRLSGDGSPRSSCIVLSEGL